VGDDGYKDGALEFMGDHKPAGPYKGGKYSIFEGGTRTPFITWWPGTIEPGVSDEVVCTIDLATSLASHLGLSLPEESYIDSLDVMDALLGKEGARGREHLIQQDNGGKGNFGFRKGKWKLLRHAKKMARNVKVEEKLASENVDRLMLVDLEKDPGERTNLAQSNPEMTEKLNSELQALLDRGRSR
jgi:arylsulfatase A-like enzyme